MIEVEITGKEMVEALQAERKLLSQAIVAQADAELAAHVHSKACDELTQTMHAERQLRQEAETRLTQTQDEMSRILHEGLKLEAARDYWLGKHAEAEAELNDVHLALDECKVECDYPDGKAMGTRARDAKLGALVTEETAALLEWLAEGIDCLAPAEDSISTPKIDEARALAAQIREVLDDGQA